MKPYLGDRYYEFPYRLIWWPQEDYKGMSWQRIIERPAQSGNSAASSGTSCSTGNTRRRRRSGIPAHRFSMFVRKDVAAQVWDWGAPAAAAGAGAGEPANPYEGGQRIIAAMQQIGRLGHAGNAAGAVQLPRAPWPWMARVTSTWRTPATTAIQVFNPDGTFLRQWGSTCKLDTNEGCQGDGRGQFNEPWGIAVGQDGSVYVSDTWNHRIQKFDQRGQFRQAMWGQFGSTGGELGQPNLFYGPRSLAVGPRRQSVRHGHRQQAGAGVQPDRRVRSASSAAAGVVDGRLDEPVGLAQDADGNWYVADTWNQRIQKFDAGVAIMSRSGRWTAGPASRW